MTQPLCTHFPFIHFNFSLPNTHKFIQQILTTHSKNTTHQCKLNIQTFLPPAEVQERVLSVIKNFDKVDPSKVAATSKFGDDLGLDSLDSVEVVMAIEDEFAIEIPDAEADRIGSVGDAVEYIAAHPMAK